MTRNVKYPNNYPAEVSNMGAVLKGTPYEGKNKNFINFLSVRQCVTVPRQSPQRHRRTQWLSLLTAVQMQTEILSPRHWGWPSGCYSMAACPPSCHPAHSLFFNAPHCVGKRRPILTHISRALVSPGASPEDVKLLGEFWMSPGDTASTFNRTHLHAPRRRQLRQACEEELWQNRTTPTQGGKEYTGGGACDCCGRAEDCLWVSYCSHCCGGNTFSCDWPGRCYPFPCIWCFSSTANKKFITRHLIREWMQGIDLFLRSSVFLSRDVFQIYEDIFLSLCKLCDAQTARLTLTILLCSFVPLSHEQTHSCLIYFFFLFCSTRQLNLKLSEHQRRWL